MKPNITKERLLELCGSLDAIIKELLKDVDVSEANPRKRRNLKQIRVAKYANYFATKKYKGTIIKKSKPY